MLVLKILLNLFIVILLILGLCTFALIVYFWSDILLDKVQEIMRRKNKIRFLCKHEYALNWKWDDKYVLQCEKCGKKINVKIYDSKFN